MVRATWNGKVLAESDDTVVVDGNHYFPADAVDPAYLRTSPTKTTCHWKGEASYHSVEVDGEANRDAAWFYPDPLPEAEKLGLTGRVAFWRGVNVS